MRSFPNLGFDPAPGELSAVGTVLDSLLNAYNQLSECSSRMAEALEVSDSWDGDAADDFHDYGDDLPKAFETGAQSMVAAGNALDTWATQMKTNQDEAERLERDAKRAKEELKEAEADMDAAARALSHGDYDKRYAAYLKTVDRWSTADGKVQEVLDKARRLEAKHLREANAAASAIRSGKGDAFEPESDGWFVQLTDGAAKVSGEVAKWAGTAAAIAAVVPGGQPFAAGLGTVAASATLVNTVAGAGQIALDSRNKPSLVELGLNVVPAKALTGAGRQAFKSGTNTFKATQRVTMDARIGRVTRDTAKGAGRGFVNGVKNGGVVKAGRDIRDVARHGSGKVSRDILNTGKGVAGDEAHRHSTRELRDMGLERARREAAANALRLPFDTVDGIQAIRGEDAVPKPLRGVADAGGLLINPTGDRVEDVIARNSQEVAKAHFSDKETYPHGDTEKALERKRGKWGD